MMPIENMKNIDACEHMNLLSVNF